MVSVSEIFKGSDWSAYPSEEWSKGVSEAVGIIGKIEVEKSQKKNIKNFLDSIGTLSKLDIKDILHISESFDILGSIKEDTLKNINLMLESINVDDKQIDGIKNFSKAVRELSRSFNKLKQSGINKLNSLTTSVTILSAVDKKQLGSIIGVLDENKEKLANVTKELRSAGGRAGADVKQSQEKVSKKTSFARESELSPGEQQMIEKFDMVLEKFDNVLEAMLVSGKGKDAGEEDKVRR